MAMIAYKCPEVQVVVLDINEGKHLCWHYMLLVSIGCSFFQLWHAAATAGIPVSNGHKLACSAVIVQLLVVAHW